MFGGHVLSAGGLLISGCKETEKHYGGTSLEVVAMAYETATLSIEETVTGRQSRLGVVGVG